MPQAHVLLDRSASMGGYFARGPIKGAATPEKGQIVGENPYRILLLDLPDLFSRMTDKPDLRFFGSQIPKDPLPINSISQAAEEKFYKSGDNQHSFIRDALSFAAGLPAPDLTLIFTDLFPDEQDTGGASALRAPLEQIIGNNRVVGVLGIMAPFNGRITDLPHDQTTPNGAMAFSGGHPLYVLMIGPEAAVRHFHDALGAYLGTDIRDIGVRYADHIETHFNIFGGNFSITQQPLLPWLGTQGSKDKGPIQLSAKPTQFLHVQGLNFLPEQLPLFSVRPSESLYLQADASAKMPAGGVLGPANGTVTTKVWQLPSACGTLQRTSHLELGNPRSLMAEQLKEGAIDVLPAGVRQHLPPRHGYLVSVSLEMQPDANLSSPDLEWLNDWSVSARTLGEQLRRHSGIFPTLNLTSILGPLADTVGAEQRRQGRVVFAHSEFVVYIEN